MLDNALRPLLRPDETPLFRENEFGRAIFKGIRISWAAIIYSLRRKTQNTLLFRENEFGRANLKGSRISCPRSSTD